MDLYMRVGGKYLSLVLSLPPLLSLPLVASLPAHSLLGGQLAGGGSG